MTLLCKHGLCPIDEEIYLLPGVLKSNGTPGLLDMGRLNTQASSDLEMDLLQQDAGL